MTQYIDKSVVKAEIERWRDGIKKGILSIPLTGSDRAYATYEYEILGKVRDFLDTLDTLEMKDVDLDEEFDNYTKNILACDIQFEPFTHLYNCAKHFFELGLNANKGE